MATGVSVRRCNLSLSLSLWEIDPSPSSAGEADWLLYTQAEISHEPRRVTPFGPRVLLESPRISPTALRLGTSSAPITEV